MTLERYYHMVIMAMLDNPEWRYGQALFNVLVEARPELAASLAGTDADPFHASAYDDRRIVNFHERLAWAW